MPDTTAPKQEHTFESAIARLEQIVSEMESEQLPLDRLLTVYEEGASLVKICQQTLATAEKKIEIIQQKAGGGIEVKPFQPGEKADARTKKDINLF